MHWFESFVYFSAAPIAALILPLWTYRLLALGLIMLPLGNHSGFGSWIHEIDYNHYIHHSKFNWNYGQSPIWDHLMGTNFKRISSSRLIIHFFCWFICLKLYSSCQFL